MKGAGIPEAVVRDIIGHDSKAVSANYTHWINIIGGGSLLFPAGQVLYLWPEAVSISRLSA